MTLRRTMATLGAAVILSSALAACGGDDVDKVRLSIGSPADPVYAAILVADQEGFFDDAGVAVEIVPTEGGPAPTQTMIAGQSDIAMNSDVQILSLSAENADMRAMGSVLTSSRYLKAVVREGVDPQDIRTVGHTQGLSLLSVVRYLESVGVDPEKVELISAGPPDIPALMERGDIDVTVMWEPWAANAAAAGGTVEATSGDFGVSFGQWLATKDEWLEGNADAAAKVFEAISQANEIVSDDPAKAVDAAASYGPVDVDSYTSLLGEFEWVSGGLDEDDVTYGTEVTDFLSARDLIPTGAKPDTLILRGWYDDNVE